MEIDTTALIYNITSENTKEPAIKVVATENVPEVLWQMGDMAANLVAQANGVEEHQKDICVGLAWKLRNEKILDLKSEYVEIIIKSIRNSTVDPWIITNLVYLINSADIPEITKDIYNAVYGVQKDNIIPFPETKSEDPPVETDPESD